MQSIRRIIGLKVKTNQTQRAIGQVAESIIDPDTGKVIAFALKTWRRNKWLTLIDVLDFGARELIIGSENKLLPLDDLPRVKKIKESKLVVLNAQAITESGRYLGKVSDLVFDEHSGEILRYYIARPFILSPLKAFLILDRKEISRVERKGVIVKDPEEKVPAQALPPLKP